MMPKLSASHVTIITGLACTVDQDRGIPPAIALDPFRWHLQHCLNGEPSRPSKSPNLGNRPDSHQREIYLAAVLRGTLFTVSNLGISSVVTAWAVPPAHVYLTHGPLLPGMTVVFSPWNPYPFADFIWMSLPPDTYNPSTNIFNHTLRRSG
ncbi:hypothetical protein F4780DRAFT_753502 [Xylariomycetidae sp. FL0641]|nr:hypothetical protein F4780DRAFT_753502 [Xylariomycetidae sp. FL0641]